MFSRGALTAVFTTAPLIQFPKAQVRADWQPGGQICQYMTINKAKKLEYRPEGMHNTNTVAQWMVWPIAAGASSFAAGKTTDRVIYIFLNPE